MSSINESLIYYPARSFGALIRMLPARVALAIGSFVGTVGYYLSIRHKALAHANLKTALSRKRSPHEIKLMTRRLFQNYGKNFIEVFRLPLMNPERFLRLIKVEGKEHVDEAIRKGNGCILMPMHFGSWELASLSCAMLGHPYKMFVNPQPKYPRLDALLNHYRSCSGTVVISKGVGTRDILRSLKNNEVVSMVVDQGGREGVLVPFFGRLASMSVGALRIGLKLDVPVCFAIIIRDHGPYHRLIIHEPLKLENTGDVEKDILTNLKSVIRIMERYIEQYPSEYMWFYKIWKYSKESTVLILSDGKTGHLRQSQAVANSVAKALSERGITADIQIKDVVYKNSFCRHLVSVIGLISRPHFSLGRLGFLRWFLTSESFRNLMSLKADFIISCGSSTASLNYLLSVDHQAKNIAILRPGLLGFRKFKLVILPQHDRKTSRVAPGRVVWTRVAPNLISSEYLQEQSELLLRRFSHLKTRSKSRIGVLLGGNTKTGSLNEGQMKIVLNQILEAAEQMNADILITTSRRTPAGIENLLLREMKKHPRCPLLVIANRNDVPEAVGGILGLSDIVVVSGDSISMVSEAVSSSKGTVVFPLQNHRNSKADKYEKFVEVLHDTGYVLSSKTNSIGQFIFDLARNKMQTKTIDDQDLILKEVRQII